jgi:hypothetical protein
MKGFFHSLGASEGEGGWVANQLCSPSDQNVWMPVAFVQDMTGTQSICLALRV